MNEHVCIFAPPPPPLSFWSGLCKLTIQLGGDARQRSGTLVQRYKLQNQWCRPDHPHLSIIFWQDEFTCNLTITCWRLCGAGVLLGWRGPGVIGRLHPIYFCKVWECYRHEEFNGNHDSSPVPLLVIGWHYIFKLDLKWTWNGKPSCVFLK